MLQSCWVTTTAGLLLLQPLLLLLLVALVSVLVTRLLKIKNQTQEQDERFWNQRNGRWEKRAKMREKGTRKKFELEISRPSWVLQELPNNFDNSNAYNWKHSTSARLPFPSSKRTYAHACRITLCEVNTCFQSSLLLSFYVFQILLQFEADVKLVDRLCRTALHLELQIVTIADILIVRVHNF